MLGIVRIPKLGYYIYIKDVIMGANHPAPISRDEAA